MDNKVPVFTPVEKPKKVYNPLLKIDKIFGYIVFALCFLVIDFALMAEMRIGFTISFFALVIVTAIYLTKKGNKSSVFSIICGVLALVGSVSFTLFNNYLINTFMFFLIMGLYVIFALGYSNSFTHNLGSFKIGFDMFSGVFITPLKTIPVVVGSAKASSKKSIGTLAGIIVAIPFLCAIIPLLVKSDAAFEGLVSGVIKEFGKYALELLLALVVFPYAYSYLFSLRNKAVPNSTKNQDKKVRVLPYSACVSFMAVISVTYIIYLFSQLAYFFSAFSNILPEGYKNTASEFARRGFFEMFAVCVINVVIITLVNMFLKQPKKTVALKLLSLFVSLFSVLLIVIAMQKMKMNIGIYGMTANRILVFTFMVMMLVVFAFFILHQFAPKVPYMQPIIVICSVLFIALAFSNVDAYVAKYNINAFDNNKIQSLDVDAIADLSDSGVKYLCKIASRDDGYGKEAQEKLYNIVANTYTDEFDVKLTSLKLKDDNDFRKMNYAHIEALHEINSYYGTLDEKEQMEFANRCYINNYDKFCYDEEQKSYFDMDNQKDLKLNPKTNLYQ